MASKLAASRILAISTVGVIEAKSPAVISYAWARTGGAVFVPQVIKRQLGTRRWTRLRDVFPLLLHDAMRIITNLRGVDMVFVDVSRQRPDALCLAVSHLLIGMMRCSKLRYVPHTKWGSVWLGPMAGATTEDTLFDSRIAIAAQEAFPAVAHKITCAQTARAISLLYWAAARYGVRLPLP